MGPGVRARDPKPGTLYSLAAAGSGDWGRGVLGENAVAAGMVRAILLPYLQNPQRCWGLVFLLFSPNPLASLEDA